MRFGRLILMASLMIGPAAYSLDRNPPPKQKVLASKDAKTTPPTAKDPDADARLNKWESHMTRRDQQMDKRMKSRPNETGGRGRGK